MGYFKRTFIGLSWLSAFRIISRAIATARFVLLARILTPAQFGIFGIASIVLSFLEILAETGINVLLIQEKNADKYINSAWVISVLRGFILSFLIIALSPFVVFFFEDQDLYRFLFLIALVPLIRGFINPSIIKFQKELKFNKEFYLRITIFSFDSIISIILTLLTKDAISFIWGFISGAVLEVILSFVLFKPIPKLKPELELVKHIIKQGKWVTTYIVFNYITQAVDTIIVGKFLGTGSLGIYQMGYKISTLPISEISDVANKVIFPVYSRIAQDRDRLLRAFKKTIISVILISGLAGLFLFFLPQKITVLILGDQWIQVGAIIKILAIFGVLRAIASIPSTLFLSMNKQNYVAVMTFFRFLILAVTIIPFTLTWGVMGTAYSAVFSSLMEFPLIAYFFLRILRIKSYG